MNKIKNLSKKSKIIVISIVVFVLLLIGGTLAWLEWSSEINALVNGRVCAPEIVFLGGTTINGNGLRPVSNKENGLKKDINVNLENLCENDTATMDLYLKLEVFPSGLADETFVWELYRVTTTEVNNETVETLTLLNDGNFENKAQNDTIELTDNTQIITSNISNYRLYIYLDGTQDNPASTQNQFFKFSIYGQGRDAIYKADTVSNSLLTGTNNSYFLVENLPKTDIESIDIVPFNRLPEGQDVDISANGDGSVLLTYVDDDDDGLYEVYLGTSNGLLKMNTKMDYMFAGLTNVSTLDLSRLDTSNVTSMVGVFYNSPSLTNINMSTWDTSNVTTMYSMFQSSKGLTMLNLSSFNTTSVKNMAKMFYDCSGLTTLDLSSFYTPELTTVTDFIYGMFQGCTSLETLDMRNFDVSKVGNLSRMFGDCRSLKTLDLSNFYTTSATNMNTMFSGCSSLETLDISNFNTSKVENMESMFRNCSKLKELDIDHFNTEKVTKMNAMFYNCASLVNLDLSSFNTELVTTMNSMFYGCSELVTLNVSSFNTEKVTNMGAMFYSCSKLKKLNLSNFYTPLLTTVREFIYGMFAGCSSLEELNVSNFDTSHVADMYSMFSGCSSLTNLDLSSFESTSLTSTGTMAGLNGTFSGCTSLTAINLSKIDFSVINSYNSTFNNVPAGCEIIVKDCTEFDDFVGMFGSKSGLHTVNNDSCTA